MHNLTGLETGTNHELMISYIPPCRRVSVIRGRVVTRGGDGVIGVRVSVTGTKDANKYGFTLTRPGGW